MPADVASEARVSRKTATTGAAMTLAAVPHVAWKALVAAVAGILDGPMTAYLAVIFLVSVPVLFAAGLVAGRRTRGVETRTVNMVVFLTTWFLVGFTADLLAGLGTASFLSQVVASLGDNEAGALWTDITVGELARFMVFSLGGGVAGVTAALIYHVLMKPPVQRLA